MHLGLVIALLSEPAPPALHPPPEAPDPATAARAKALADEAYDHLRARRFEDAIAGFTASARLEWRRSNDCNIGAAWLGLDVPHRAWFYLERCRRDWDRPTADADPPPLPDAITARIHQLEAGPLAQGHRRVELVATPSDATLELDALAPDEPLPAPLVAWLPDGPLTVRLHRPDGATSDHPVAIGPDTPPTLRLTAPAPAPPPAPTPLPAAALAAPLPAAESAARPWLWTLAGGALLSGLGAVALRVDLARIDDELALDRDGFSRVSATRYAELTDRRDWEAPTFYGALAAATLLGGAALWLWIDGDAPPTAPAGEVTAAGAWWRGRFSE